MTLCLEITEFYHCEQSEAILKIVVFQDTHKLLRKGEFCMDFFNTLSEIRKNKDNFKRWEEEQKDEVAKREELHKRRKHRDEEIARAKALGTKIIDVIDIMDNHSESVAENVETATQPFVASAPFVALGVSGVGAWKLAFKPAGKKIAEIRHKIINDDNNKKLAEEIKKNIKPDKNGKKRGFYTYDFLDKNKIEKIEDLNLKKEAKKVFRQYEKDIAPHIRNMKLGVIAMAASTLASFIGINIFAAKLQVDSSKIARFQARENLKDPKNFVNYTPEQIQKAQDEIKKHPEWKKKDVKEELNSGFLSSIINLFADRKAYKKSLENDKDESKLVTRNLTKEEIENAKKDKEIIQRTVRIINNEAEKYSQRMEVASDVLIGGTPFLGAAIGAGTSWILNKFNVIEKYVDDKVEKNGSDKAKELYKIYKERKATGKSAAKQYMDFFEAYVNDVPKNGNQFETISKQVKNSLHAGLSHSWGSNIIVGFAGAVLTGTAGALIGLQLQKNASRAGRYTAKVEIEKDPMNFIGYTDEDYKEVKDVKATEKPTSTVKETVMFLPAVLKQYWAYRNFRNNEYKDKQLLNEQLKKQEVTDEQMKEAKNLQRKVFNTFEKVDDNSQTYSEATEAAIDIAQPFVYQLGHLLIASPVIYFGVQLLRGKISKSIALEKLTNFLSSSSTVMQSGLFKKYLSDVAENVSTKVNDVSVRRTPLKTLFNDIDLKKDSAIEIISKSFKNVDNFVDDFAKMSVEEQKNMLYQLETFISDVSKYFEISSKTETFENILRKMRYHQTNEPQVRADALDLLLNCFNSKIINNQQRLDAAQQLLGECGLTKWDAILISTIKSTPDMALNQISQMGKESNKITQNTKLFDLKSILPENYTNPKKFFDERIKALGKMTDDEFADSNYARFFEKLYMPDMTKERLKNILSNVQKVFDNIPKEEVKKIWDKLIEEFNKNPDEFVELVKSGQIMSIFRTPSVNYALAATGVSWLTFSIGVNYAISSWLGEIQLQAGRLGVMKAIEDLDDYRYYANAEPMDLKTVPMKNKLKTAVVMPNNKTSQTNLLKKYSI